MAHQHNVVDGDIHFTINPVTRVIARADATKSSLVVGDHNSERFTFEIPKTVEGHDMSLCNVIRVHYLNTSSDNKSVQSLGVYEVDDFASDPADETIMRFSWLISSKATKHVGPLAFTIQFACMTGFKVDYSWQSGIFSGITVSNAVNGAEVVIEEYADILQQWWEQLYASSELPIAVIPFEDFEALEGNTKNGMLYMLLGDPAIEDLEKIPSIEQNITELTSEVQTNKESITNLTTDLDNLEKEVETNKQTITSLTSEVQTNKESITNLNTDLDNLEKEVETNFDNLEKDVETKFDNLEKNVNDNTTELDSLREAYRSDYSKWAYGEYTKLYEYDTETDTAVTTQVTTGLYIIRAEYFNPATNDRASTTVMLDTFNRASASTSISFAIAKGIILQYRIGCRVIDGELGVIEIIPYHVVQGVEISDDNTGVCDWTCAFTAEAEDITLYGRCIYTNPVG